MSAATISPEEIRAEIEAIRDRVRKSEAALDSALHEVRRLRAETSEADKFLPESVYGEAKLKFESYSLDDAVTAFVLLLTCAGENARDSLPALRTVTYLRAGFADLMARLAPEEFAGALNVLYHEDEGGDDA